MHQEHHLNINRYIKDIIFAANDGIVTTFAVVAGVVGANLSPIVILVLGIANLISDGFAMATGNYLGTKSEQNLYAHEEKIERREIEKVPEKEQHETRLILEKKGYKGRDLDDMERLVMSNKKYWLDFMMHEEIGMAREEIGSPVKNGLTTFISFIIAGAIPLIPYVLNLSINNFIISSIGTGLALFIVGALRSYFSERSWIALGFEMFLVGGSAAAMSYAMGTLLKIVLNI